jgi:hypothetical protein
MELQRGKDVQLSEGQASLMILILINSFYHF